MGFEGQRSTSYTTADWKLYFNKTVYKFAGFSDNFRFLSIFLLDQYRCLLANVLRFIAIFLQKLTHIEITRIYLKTLYFNDFTVYAILM